jgi:hypothetical protein
LFFLVKRELNILSGGHVISLLQEKRLHLATGIAQSPFVGTTSTDLWSIASLRLLLFALFDALKQAFGGAPLYVPAYAMPGEVGALISPGPPYEVYPLAVPERFVSGHLFYCVILIRCS